jgi:putative membrane protein
MPVLYDLLLPLAYYGPGREHDGGWWPWFPLFPLLWFGLIIFAFWFFGRRWRWHHERSGVERARDILAERYARGEINGEEYRERLESLRE